MLIINPLTLDLNSWYNVLNPRFISHTDTKKIGRKKKAEPKEKTPNTAVQEWT